MTDEPFITMVGNLTADPELRFTPQGHAVINFTVAQTPRSFDRQTNEWKDGETIFMRCSAWRQTAENAAESLHRGYRVIVYGRLISRTFTTQAGEQRTTTELQVDEIGASLRHVTATIKRTERGGQAPQQGQQPPQQPAQDPWATPQPGPPQQQTPQPPQQQQPWMQQQQYDPPPF